VLPLAATEQHGPHLPVGTDVMIAQAYLARVRELAVRSLPATFLPIQPVGISTEHTDYPGTLTLPTEAALKAWMALGESVARAGIKKLVMVTSHGGNSAAMSLVAQDLRAQHGLLVVTTGWSRLRRAGGIFSPRRNCSMAFMAARSRPRSCWRDTGSMCVARRSPIFARRGSRWKRIIAGYLAHRPAPFAWQAQDLHPSGAAGDATQASAEKGERLLDHGARAFCELLADVDRFDLQALANVPKI
jgi:creatinine amidohydrolase